MYELSILVADHNASSVVSRSIFRQLAELDNVGVTVLAPSVWRTPYGVARFEPEPGHSPLVVIPSSTLFGRNPARVLFRGLGTAMKRLKPNILLVNAEPENYLAAHALITQRMVSPATEVVIVSWRNIDYGEKVFPYRLSTLNLWCEKFSIAQNAACIAFNERAKEIMTAKGLEHVCMIPPSTSTSMFCPDHMAQPGKRAFTIGYAGRLARQKGIDDLFRAVARLNGEYRLLIVGNGAYRQHLVSLAEELMIAGRIDWQTATTQEELVKQYRRMDVLVLPSRTEGQWKEQFGRVLIEAMSTSVPVVGSDSGEIPNVVGDCGMIFSEGQWEDLGACLSELRDDIALRRELGKKGRDRVKRLFSVEVVSQQYYEFFRQLMNAPKTSQD